MEEVSILKKLLIFILAVALISTASAQVTATQELPSQFGFEEEFTGTITVLPTSEQNFDIAVYLPVTWEILSWEISGNKTAANFEHDLASLGTSDAPSKVYEIYHWLLNGPTTENIEINYIAIPKSTGEQVITLSWFYPEGFGSKDIDVFVSGDNAVVPDGSRCGNDICEQAYGESLFKCPQDCPFRYKDNITIWITLLIIILLIMFFGIAYRLYKMYIKKRGDSRLFKAKPITTTLSKPFSGPIPAKLKEAIMIKKVTPVKKMIKTKKKKTVKKKTVKKVTKKKVKPKVVKKKVAKKKVVKKKPAKKKKVVKKKAVKKKTVKKKVAKKKTVKKKLAKKKTTRKKPKHSDFYSTSIRKLERIKKNLK